MADLIPMKKFRRAKLSESYDLYGKLFAEGNAYLSTNSFEALRHYKTALRKQVFPKF